VYPNAHLLQHPCRYSSMPGSPGSLARMIAKEVGDDEPPAMINDYHALSRPPGCHRYNLGHRERRFRFPCSMTTESRAGYPPYWPRRPCARQVLSLLVLRVHSSVPRSQRTRQTAGMEKEGKKSQDGREHPVNTSSVGSLTVPAWASRAASRGIGSQFALPRTLRDRPHPNNEFKI
jgi:hypothetical protein